MAEIFLYKPQSMLTAAENLGAFIAKCRDELTVFGPELDWRAEVWLNRHRFSRHLVVR